MRKVLLCKLPLSMKRPVSEWEKQMIGETLLQVYGFGASQGLIMAKNLKASCQNYEPEKSLSEIGIK